MNQTNATVVDRPEECTEARLFMSERLEFPRGVLKLLKETELFGPMVEKALEDIDAIAARFGLQIESGGEPDAFEV